MPRRPITPIAPCLLALLLGVSLGCGDGEGATGGSGGGTGGSGGTLDPSDFPLLFPVGSQVFVQVEGAYFFESASPEEGGEPLGSCSISPGLGLVPDTVLADFEAALPPQSGDFFSIQVRGTDFVSWGLSDVRLGEEWSNQPGGEVKGDCAAGENTVSCTVLWTGRAQENFVPREEPPEATVELTCIFAAVPPCNLSCGDGNPCTANPCINSECRRISVREGARCDQIPGVDEFCSADARCVVPRPL